MPRRRDGTPHARGNVRRLKPPGWRARSVVVPEKGRRRLARAASGLCGKGNSVSARACRAVPAFAGNRAEPWPFAREMRAVRGESLSSSFASASAARHTVGYTCARSCCLFVSAGPTAAENLRPAPIFQPSGPPNADSRS